MVETAKDKHGDYAILEMSDFLKLKSIAKMRAEENAVIITTEQLLFLNALMQEISINLK